MTDALHLLIIDEQDQLPDVLPYATDQAARAALAQRRFDELMGRRDAGHYPELFPALRAAVDGPDEAFAEAVNAAWDAHEPEISEDLAFYSGTRTLNWPQDPDTDARQVDLEERLALHLLAENEGDDGVPSPEVASTLARQCLRLIVRHTTPTQFAALRAALLPQGDAACSTPTNPSMSTAT